MDSDGQRGDPLSVYILSVEHEDGTRIKLSLLALTGALLFGFIFGSIVAVVLSTLIIPGFLSHAGSPHAVTFVLSSIPLIIVLLDCIRLMFDYCRA